MIISRIIGGLGNQMFQYAIGRALSIERNMSLLLDVSSFDKYNRHQGFELTRVFNCSPQIATNNDVRRVLGLQSSHVFKRILSQALMSPFRRQELVLEPHYHFWQGAGTVPSTCYLQGYWQSEKYFERYRTAIQEDFAFKLPFVGKNVELAARISQTNSVSLHVRRGDYLSDKKATALHGLCSIDYYREATESIGIKIDAPTFFIFSDDIDWVKKNLKIRFPCQYVDHNQGLDSFNDMHLMSLCHHNIIANSSFSWWAAWLNANECKLVLAPKKWFSIPINTSDLIPDTWTLL